VMKLLPSLRVVLDLDPLSEPIRGRVVAERGRVADARAFSGWIELSSLIEQMRAEVDIEAAEDPDTREPNLRTSA
jgi:hypothetical protein